MTEDLVFVENSYTSCVQHLQQQQQQLDGSRRGGDENNVDMQPPPTTKDVVIPSATVTTTTTTTKFSELGVQQQQQSEQRSSIMYNNTNSSNDRYNNSTYMTSTSTTTATTIDPTPHPLEGLTSTINNNNNAATTNDGSSTIIPNSTNINYYDEEEFTIVSMSPTGDERVFPSSSRQYYQQQQHQQSYNNNNYDHSATTDSRQPPPTRESVLQRLCETLLRRSLTKIDLSQRGLIPSDARLVKMALLQNQQVTTLKLGYNNLGDVGAKILANGIYQQGPKTNNIAINLLSLDLGFNNIGDIGCTALCSALSSRLHTLYLAGNSIGVDGAIAIADLIQKRNSRLRKLYLTGNLLGPDGVKAITEAIIETEQRQLHSTSTIEEDDGKLSSSSTSIDNAYNGSIEELYLGGSGMGSMGCQYIAQLLEHSQRIRIISLPNCDINDESIQLISNSIKMNRQRLPLQSLQLSFNRISCKGVECLVNSVWGSSTLKELLLDNNEIGDRGIQHIAAVLLPHVKTLEVLNLGFNLIKAPGIQILMKAIVDTNCTIRSLSISGNTVDTSTAKAISYSLAYNRTLQSLSLINCNIGHEGQRHISAGIVSNSHSVLREVSGYDLGPVIVTLGFPSDLESWSNDQILYFLHNMWKYHKGNNSFSVDQDGSHNFSPDEEEKLTDPLNFLGGPLPSSRPAPEDATIVVEVANKAFAELGEHGLEGFSRKREKDILQQYCRSSQTNDNIALPLIKSPTMNSNGNVKTMLPTNKITSFVASPEVAKQVLPDPARKTRIAEWLSSNMKELVKLSQLPFHSGDLWRLHQHFFSPVVKECGGDSTIPSSNASMATTSHTMSSVPEVSRPSSTENPYATIMQNSDGDVSAVSQPTITNTGNQMASLPILKRKVSYRFLGEAAICSSSSTQNGIDHRNINAVASTPQTVSLMIDGGPVGHTMPPTTKRARRNRSRISFLPRIKAKVDSYLDISHDKALIIMRQLYYVERAILSGQVNPLDSTENGIPRIHLCGDLANDAEVIIVDML